MKKKKTLFSFSPSFLPLHGGSFLVKKYFFSPRNEENNYREKKKGKRGRQKRERRKGTKERESPKMKNPSLKKKINKF